MKLLYYVLLHIRVSLVLHMQAFMGQHVWFENPSVRRYIFSGSAQELESILRFWQTPTKLDSFCLKPQESHIVNRTLNTYFSFSFLTLQWQVSCEQHIPSDGFFSISVTRYSNGSSQVTVLHTAVIFSIVGHKFWPEKNNINVYHITIKLLHNILIISL